MIPGADTVGTKAGYEILRPIPNAEVIVHEGLPHNITNGLPEGCASDLRRFLLLAHAPS